MQAGKSWRNPRRRFDDVIQRRRATGSFAPENLPERNFSPETVSAETPVRSSVADRIIHGGDVYIARPRRRCAAEVPAPGAPIDNRWNKKLEFVYSLVTQIRAAARHPRPTLSGPLPAPAASPTTTAADVSDQREPAFLFRWRALRHHQHHHRRRTFPHVTDDAARGTNTSRAGAALPKRRRQLHRQRPPIPSRYHRHVDHATPRARARARARFTLFFPTFPCPARRFVPSDEFAELLARPGPECICQTVKQIGRQLTNTNASLVAAHSSTT